MSRLRILIYSCFDLDISILESSTRWLGWVSHLPRLPHCCEIPLLVQWTIVLIFSPQVDQHGLQITLTSRDWVSDHAPSRARNTAYLTKFIALTIYDLILSFPKELKCIWKRKFGTGTFLYLSIRYGTVVYILFQLLECIIVPKNMIVSTKSAIQHIQPWSDI